MASVTITVAQQSSVLTGFPVFIDLADIPTDRDFWTAVTRDNLRAFDSDGGAQLPLDIYALDAPSNTGVIVVRRTLSDTGTTTIFLDTGGTAEALPTDPLGAEAVWADFEFVLFDNDEVDRTDFSGAVTEIGTYKASSTTLPFDAAGFDGSFDYMRSPDLGHNPTFTIGGTAASQRAAGSVTEAIVSYNNRTSDDRRVTLSFRDTDEVDMWDNVNLWTTLSAPVSVVANQEYRVVGRYDGSGNRALFVDGSISGSDSGLSAVDTAVDYFTIGRDDIGREEAMGNGEGYVGYSFIRFEALSDDWLSADNTNLTDTTSFYTVEEAADPIQVQVTHTEGYSLSSTSSDDQLTHTQGYALGGDGEEALMSHVLGYALTGPQPTPAPVFDYDDPEGCSQLFLDEINSLFSQIETDLNDRLNKDDPQVLLDDLPVNYQRIINVKEATDSSDAVTLAQAIRLIGAAQ